MIACVCDLETTGTEPTDQIVEIGSYLLEDDGLPFRPFDRLVAPSIQIPPTASAIHHICDEDVFRACAEPWERVSAAWLASVDDADVMVAHNAKFEMMHLGEMTAPRPWICTMKCAMRAWPDAPGFSNQALRYWRRPAHLDRSKASESHRALPDAYVTAFLLRELLAEHSLDALIGWSAAPAMPPRVTFGKHRGAAWADLPSDYLEWIVDKSEMDADTKGCARAHLDSRRTIVDLTARGRLYLELATKIVPLARSEDHLSEWWREEAARRAEHGIVKGTPHYDKLVEMCAEQKAKLRMVPAS